MSVAPVSNRWNAAIRRGPEAMKSKLGTSNVKQFSTFRLFDFLTFLFALPIAGCSSLIDPNVPEQIRELREPETGAEYLLYRPSAYTSTSQWPLLVVCHSSFGDSPNRQIKDWTELAESNGFLVAAPRLEHDRNYNPLDKDDQTVTQNLDEGRILSTVRHVQIEF
jgi:poly(3-hydroxybutyrate) depolymerase